MPGPCTAARGWAALGASLLALLLWDASGADLLLSQAVGGRGGFPWRDAWPLRVLLHDGGRWAALGLLAGLAWDAWRPLLPGPRRGERLWWLAVVLASALAVTALKQTSLTSCPWDLADFGGVAHYRSHWRWHLADGGPGRCFPSGHAVSAFAFIGLPLLWQGTHPRLARALLGAVLAAGLLFSLTQLLRGAHFLSHGLWTAWLCAGLALLARAWRPRWARPLASSAAPALQAAGSSSTARKPPEGALPRSS